MLSISGLISGLVGTIFGALLAHRLTKGSDKTKLTLSFHKEWTGYTMSIHRRRAYTCIKKYPSSNFNQLSKDSPKGSLSVYVILRFYDRLWLCAKSGNLNNQLTADLFYDPFYYWYFMSFLPNLMPVKDDWISAENMSELKSWIRSHTSEIDYKRYESKFTEKHKQLVETVIAS